MAGFRFLRLSLPFLALLAAAHFTPAQNQQVTLSPSIVVAGAPEIIRVSAVDADSVTGEWSGNTLAFFRPGNRGPWVALAGVDVGVETGPSTLHIVVHTSNGATRELTQTVEILPAHYRTTRLSVAPKFVEPDSEQLKIILAERSLKDKIFSESAPERLWHGSFHAPVHAVATASFGTRRTFNGTLASIHKGMDYRARTGTVVRASNDGVVVLARKLYYEGNIVVIDHGLGLYTMSMHLSRIDVREGQHVTTDEKIGLSGATGRVTGPHLHWAVRWRNAYLDPAKMLRMNLSNLR
ncbi:MAG TPA: M23 family metallopeptidase [Terracidiphilus sp.]|nr:M23 family metallopeptidase [Terracidiphilus sp.]